MKCKEGIEGRKQGRQARRERGREGREAGKEGGRKERRFGNSKSQQPGVSGNGADQEDQHALRQGGLRPVQVVSLRFTA